MRRAALGAACLAAGIAGFAAGRSGRERALRILRISRAVADLGRAEAFYRGLGFEAAASGPVDSALPGLLGLPDATARQVVMRLGEQEIALVRFEPPGPPYPPHSRSDDLWFQHLAIVVTDMRLAYARASALALAAISTGGPQTLPPRNGRVEAFKFRDPDGHPLELIHFPPGQGRAVWHRAEAGGPFLGIDHSALAVGNQGRSLRFYRGLGFAVAYRSLNYGPLQAQLDGLPSARAQVTGLRPPDANGPGLELLAYDPPGRPAPCLAANAQLTDWVTVLVRNLQSGSRLTCGVRARALRDPDRHRLILVDRLPS